MNDRSRLIELIKERALKFGQFTLASGKTSNFYLDGRLITLDAEGLRLIARGILEALEGVEFDAVGGMSIGADPIVGGVLTVAAERGTALSGFLVRKETKGHGTRKHIEGPVSAGAKVVIVDDTITTGGSALQAAERAIEFGCQVVQVVGVIDRLEGGAETFAAKGIPFRALLTVRDLGVGPDGKPSIN